jgi:hypothetical protein
MSEKPTSQELTRQSRDSAVRPVVTAINVGQQSLRVLLNVVATDVILPSAISDPADSIALFMVPLFVGGIFWASAWIHYRVINRDKPVTNPQRRLMRY